MKKYICPKCGNETFDDDTDYLLCYYCDRQYKKAGFYHSHNETTEIWKYKQEYKYEFVIDHEITECLDCPLFVCLDDNEYCNLSNRHLGCLPTTKPDWCKLKELKQFEAFCARDLR